MFPTIMKHISRFHTVDIGFPRVMKPIKRFHTVDTS